MKYKIGDKVKIVAIGKSDNCSTVKNGRRKSVGIKQFKDDIITITSIGKGWDKGFFNINGIAQDNTKRCFLSVKLRKV